MRYLSIYTGPERTAGPTDDELKLIEESQKDGSLLGAEGCLPIARGALVRQDGGSVTVTDGPFAEAKEVVGGFAILELGSKEDAIDAAKRFLDAVGTDGQCEIRELWPTPALAGEERPKPGGTTRYLSLYRSVESEQPPTEAEIAAMNEFMQEFIANGKLLATEGCLPSSRGARVRREGSSYSVVDGPFTESKEIVGGFAVLAGESKDDVLDMTKRFLQVAGEGECEVRELFDAEAFVEG
jgi:hypothetical protein